MVYPVIGIGDEGMNMLTRASPVLSCRVRSPLEVTKAVDQQAAANRDACAGGIGCVGNLGRVRETAGCHGKQR